MVARVCAGVWLSVSVVGTCTYKNSTGRHNGYSEQQYSPSYVSQIQKSPITRKHHHHPQPHPHPITVPSFLSSLSALCALSLSLSRHGPLIPSHPISRHHHHHHSPITSTSPPPIKQFTTHHQSSPPLRAANRHLAIQKLSHSISISRNASVRTLSSSPVFTREKVSSKAKLQVQARRTSTHRDSKRGLTPPHHPSSPH